MSLNVIFNLFILLIHLKELLCRRETYLILSFVLFNHLVIICQYIAVFLYCITISFFII